MTAVEPISNPALFFIDGKVLNGATGALFVRTGSVDRRELVPVERLVYRLVAPRSFYNLLHEHFTKKALFHFEVRFHMHILVSVTAILSELVKSPDGDVAVLVEFDLP